MPEQFKTLESIATPLLIQPFKRLDHYTEKKAVRHHLKAFTVSLSCAAGMLKIGRRSEPSSQVKVHSGAVLALGRKGC